MKDSIATLLQLAGPRASVPAERHDRVRAVAHAHWRRSVHRRRVRRIALWAGASLAAAAGLLVAIRPGLGRLSPALPGSGLGAAAAEVVTGVVRSRALGSVRPGDRIDVGDRLETSSGGRLALRLAGGASLRVDTGSRLELQDDSALMLDQGAVYVDTHASEEAASSVEIRTPLGTVRDAGTRFEVRLDGGSMTVRVREGVAEVERGSRRYRAEAGRQLVAAASGEVAAGAAPAHGEAWSWMLEVAPAFDLEGRSLEAFLGWVARETGWRVRFEEPSIAASAPSLILHGSIEGLRPDEAPAAVLPTCGLRHRVEDGTLTIGRLPDRE